MAQIDWKAKGYESREAYIREQAEEHGIDYASASMLADLLGDDELFDGFISGLEDAEMFMEDYE